MPENNQSWSICVLCYNEEGAITTVLEGLNQFLKQNLEANYEIIVVNDGSTDNSLNQIEEFKQSNPESNIKIFNHKQILVLGWP